MNDPNDPTGPDEAPSTSTMALSFSQVVERLPAGVSLERGFGASVLTVALRGTRPALGLVFGGVVAAFYVASISPGLVPAAPLGVLAFFGYCAAVFAFGRRRVTLEDGRVSVKTLPAPMFGDGSTRGTIDRVDVVIIGVRAGRRSYRIDVVINGRRRPVVQDLQSEDTALVLARYLAAELRVELPRHALQLA